MNAEEFRKYGRELVDYVANYLEGGVNEYPPSPLVDKGYMRSLISQVSFREIMGFLDTIWIAQSFLFP